VYRKGDNIMKKEEFEDVLNKQVELEEKIVKLVKEVTENVKNILIKSLLQSIGLDSQKHADMLRAIVARLKHETPFISEEERERIGNQIKEHIELEKKAIKTYSELLEKIDDKKIKMILQYIVDDEKRHHELLLKIDKIIVEPEMLKEEEFWDWIWKYSVSHGSPGG